MTDSKKDVLAQFAEACEAAASVREVNKELREQLRSSPDLQKTLRQALIEDLLRVYNHTANPYKGFAASRQRYRQLGHYPEILVTDFFGNHEEFQRAADLKDKRNTTRVRNRAARLHTHQRIADYAERELKPYAGAYQKPLPKGVFDVAVLSDLHGEWCDPFALEVALDVIRMAKPAQIVLNGDLVDFPQVSRHRKLPGHFHLNLQQEIDHCREKIMRPIREAAPDANILFVIGNHEYRLVNYIADTSPELASLAVYDDVGNKVPVTFESLFGLKALRIGLVCRQNFLAPFAKDRKREHQENWVVIGDSLVVTHGVSCAKFAADEQLKRYQKSGTSGHTHRPQIITGNSLGTGSVSWTSTPMMAGFAVGKDYVPEPSMWNMGFGVFTVDSKERLVVPNLVLIHEKFATFAGRTWRPTKAALLAREKVRRVL